MSQQIVQKSWNLVPEIKNRLQAGEVLILPTDTVYALVVNGNDEQALTKIRKIKPPTSPQPLTIFTNREKAEQVVMVNRAAEEMMKHFPYPVTMIMPAKPNLSEIITDGYKSVFVACPDRFIYDLVNELPFPLVGLAASFGETKIANAKLAQRFFSDKVSLIIDGGQCKYGISGTLIDFTVEMPTIMTFGTVSVDDLRPLVSQIVLPSHLMK